MSRSIGLAENAEAAYYSESLHRSYSTATNAEATFRNITAESTNQQHFSHHHSSGGNSDRQYAGDDKLVSRLYKTIESQENDIEQLNKKFYAEQRRREQTDIEMAELKEELSDTKQRFANFKKQEREQKHKAELDQKERRREEAHRWETTMEEITALRKSLAEKNQQLAEFQQAYSNLQASLDQGNTKTKSDLEEAEKRVDLLAKMLENCYSQLSRTEKQLGKERKMKLVLIKINEALQNEIKKKDKLIIESKPTEVSINKSSSLKSKESEDQTSDIMKELQLEDALLYFDEVRKEYEDRPKIYREFLEVIRLYKGRSLSTPEVIARISKLFHGKAKLIIGFNRFLPKDFHVNLEDVANFQGALPQPSIPAEKQGRTKDDDKKHEKQEAMGTVGAENQPQKDNTKQTIAGGGSKKSQKQRPMETESKNDSVKAANKTQIKEGSQHQEENKNEARHSRTFPIEHEEEYSYSDTESDCDNDQSESSSLDALAEEEGEGYASPINLTINTAALPLSDRPDLSMQRIQADKSYRSYKSSKYSDAIKSKNSKSTHQGESKSTHQAAGQDANGMKSKKELRARRYVESKYKHKIQTRASKSMDSGEREEEENNDKKNESDKRTPSNRSSLDVVTSMLTEASQIHFGGGGTYKTSFNITPVASSPLFAGIDSSSFVASTGSTFSTADQSTLYMPSDRYDIIEDQDYNAIEVLAEAAGIEMIGEHFGGRGR